MPSFSTITALAALASITLASPVDLSNLQKRDSFRISQVQRSTFIKNGAKQMLKTYKKYGVTVPSHVESAATSVSAASNSTGNSTGSVTATPEDEYDSLYLCPVTVGGSELQLDFDTGSADLWVFSSLMSSSETSGHSVYTPSSSATKKDGYSWDITYGDNSGAAGVVYADKVVIGGVTATSQAVEAATSVSTAFTEDTDDDGLVGLAFSSINTVEPTSQSTFFDNVKSNLAQALFAVDLKKGEAGSYDFGFIDESKYTGEIAYTDVDDSDGFWAFTAEGYTVGDDSSVSSSFYAIADTGTTLLYLPTEVVEAYYQDVSGAQYDQTQAGYVFDCSADLPSFSLIINGETRTVPGSYVNYASITSSSCYGGIQDDSDIGFSIIGDIFLKSQYVIFDQTQSTPRIGFAQQTNVTTSSGSSSSSSSATVTASTTPVASSASTPTGSSPFSPSSPAQASPSSIWPFGSGSGSGSSSGPGGPQSESEGAGFSFGNPF